MDPNRTPNQRLAMDQRLSSFDEVDATYTQDQALNEASRCLEVPHPLVPEGLPRRGARHRLHRQGPRPGL